MNNRPLQTRPRILALALLSAFSSLATAEEVTLDTVAVTGSRVQHNTLDLPVAVDAVDRSRIDADQARVNASEALAGVPGITVQNRQNYAQDLQISSRGFGARSTFGVRGVRLYVDGIPATMPDGQGQTSNIDIGSIGSVEVLRGPFSALYGNSSGGVIQVSTEDGVAPPSLTASGWGASYGTWRYGVRANGASGGRRQGGCSGEAARSGSKAGRLSAVRPGRGIHGREASIAAAALSFAFRLGRCG